jgi:hypothetical protein
MLSCHHKQNQTRNLPAATALVLSVRHRTGLSPRFLLGEDIRAWRPWEASADLSIFGDWGYFIALTSP